MHLKLGGDIFDSFRRYQARIIREYNRMVDEFSFITVDACRSIEVIQQELRSYIGRYLAGEMPVQTQAAGLRVRSLPRRAGVGARRGRAGATSAKMR